MNKVENKLEYCLFSIEELHSPILALSTLKEIEKNNATFMQKFLAYRYYRIAHSVKVLTDDKSNQQIINMQQQATADEFEELLVETTHKFIVLWEDLQEESPDYERLVEHTFILLEQLKEVEEFYSIITKEKIRNFRIYMLYSAFLSDVLHEAQKSKKILKMYFFILPNRFKE